MACRLITSPITGKEETSKTWSDIRNLVEFDTEADKLYSQLVSPEFINWFGDWVNDPNGENTSRVVNDLGEPLVVYHGTDVKNLESFDESKIKDYHEKGEKGFYFSPNQNLKFYGKEVYPVFLNVKTPLIGKEEYEKVNVDKEVNDGFIYEFKPPIVFTEILVFNPNQIKSIKNNGEFSNSNNIYNSIESTESSKASHKTIEKVKEFLQRLGIEVKGLDTERYGGINGVAKLLENVIEIAQGKEDVALVEEAFHFITEIVKLQNPTLYKQMLNKIGSYNLYKDTLSIYGQNKNYQNEDGSPNIIKIKEEAIGKVLAEYYIKSEEGITEKPELLKQTNGWWEQIKSFFLGLIGKAGFNPFEETIKDLATYEKLNAAKTIIDRIDLILNGLFSFLII